MKDLREAVRQSNSIAPCTEVFPGGIHIYNPLGSGISFNDYGWKPGDGFFTDPENSRGLYVFCSDGRFYSAEDHPQNPALSINKPGYHKTKINKRAYGSAGKIQEELDELNDAHEQGSKVMVLVELCDLYGALEGFLEANYPDIKMHDLKKFSDITKRAFKNGART